MKLILLFEHKRVKEYETNIFNYFENHNDIVTTSEGEGERRHIILMKRDDN